MRHSVFPMSTLASCCICIPLQVQQQGLMVMMNALDGNPASSAHGRSLLADTTVNHAAKLSQPQNQRNRQISTYHQQRKDAGPTEAADANDLPSDVSVTPVPSDDQSRSPNPPVKKMNKDRFEGRLLERNDSSVRGALTELHRLRSRLLHVPPPSDDATAVGKENQRDHPSVTGGRPFGALLDSLRRMNPELGGGRGRSVLPSVSSAPLQLLRLPPPREHDFLVKLPKVLPSPRPAWMSEDRRPPPEEQRPMPAVSEWTTRGNEFHQMPLSDDNFPLLHLSENHFPPHSIANEFSSGLPFPMLRMIDPHRRQVPFFVPPEHIVGHNNNNRGSSTLKSDMPTARSEPQTGRSNIIGSFRRSMELLQLGPSLSEADDLLESNCRQTLDRLVSFYCIVINS